MDNDVVTLGETLASFTSVAVGPSDGIEARYLLSFGGAESNTAIGLARLGLRVAYISRLGQDREGVRILEQLRREGIDVSGVATAELPTGLMVKDRDAAEDVHVRYWRANTAASRLGPDDVTAEVVDRARAVHVSGVTLAIGPGPRAAVLKLVRLAREAGRRVSFDPNVRLRLWSGEEALRGCLEVMPHVTDLLCNEWEAQLLSGVDDVEEAATKLRSGEVERVVVKQGGRGAVAFDGHDVICVDALDVKAVDSVGSGDAFNAGYLAGQLRGLGFRDALRLGSWTAAHVVSTLGDFEGLPRADRAVDLGSLAQTDVDTVSASPGRRP